MASVYDFSAKALGGDMLSLRRFQGQVLLIVNTASACGFTPQYRGLETLYKTLAPQGFSVLGFPCNQFGGQESGDAAQIGSFCSSTYQISFPMFDRIDVNGAAAHPLYKFLTSEKSGWLGASIKWNFTKFLIDRAGRVVARHGSMTKPESLQEKIEALL